MGAGAAGMADGADAGRNTSRAGFFGFGNIVAMLRPFAANERRTAGGIVPAKHPTEPKRWLVRGKALDGLVVTLGRYATEDEAQADYRKFADAGIYRELAIEEIAIPVPEPEDKLAAAAPPVVARTARARRKS